MQILRNITIGLTVLVVTSTARAQSCYEIFQEPVARTLETAPEIQLRIWEQTENFIIQPADPVAIPYRNVNIEDLDVRYSAGTPLAVKDFIASSDSYVRWLLHPLNTAPMVPFYKDVPHGVELGYYSASRSMFVYIQNGLYSFKLPTNQPHANGELQPSKSDQRNDVVLSLRRSEHVREVEREIGKSASLEVLTEILSVAAHHNGNGFSVRDLRPLQDGNYYLPAFSLAFFGNAIAKYHGQEFTQFWKSAYAEKVGEAKALLLLRFGLQMKTPNAQNWLIQLDRNLRPTGKIFVRDIADSSFVEFIAVELGFSEKLNVDHRDSFNISNMLQPNTENSFMHMEKGGVREETLRAWFVAHDRAYVKTLRRELQLGIEIETIESVYSHLHTDNGRLALQHYARSLRE